MGAGLVYAFPQGYERDCLMIDVQPLMYTINMSRVDFTKAVMIPLLEPDELEKTKQKEDKNRASWGSE